MDKNELCIGKEVFPLLMKKLRSAGAIGSMPHCRGGLMVQAPHLTIKNEVGIDKAAFSNGRWQKIIHERFLFASLVLWVSSSVH